MLNVSLHADFKKGIKSNNQVQTKDQIETWAG